MTAVRLRDLTRDDRSSQRATTPVGVQTSLRFALRLDFCLGLTLQFCGSVTTSDARLLVYRELGGALGLNATAGERLAVLWLAIESRRPQKRICNLQRPAVLQLASDSDVLSLTEASIWRISDQVEGGPDFERLTGERSSLVGLAAMGRRRLAPSRRSPIIARSLGGAPL